MQVDFLLGGARKSGTTSLTHYLNAHPDIYMPISEIHFFTRRYQKGFDWYHNHFKKNGFIGENSNSYISEQCADRILDYNSKMKMIFLIRNPIKRAYSDYWHEKREGRVQIDFDSGVELYLKDKMENEYFNNIFNRSKYKRMIEYYQGKFPKNQLLFLKSEDLRNNRKETYIRILDFLERRKIIPDEVTKIYNIGQNVRSKAISEMYQKYRDDVICNGGVKNNPFAYTIRFISMLNRPGTLTRKLFRKSDKLQKAHFYPEMNEKTKENLEEHFHEDIKCWRVL